MEPCPYFIKWFVSKPTWQAYKRLEVDNHSCSPGWTKIRVKEYKKILLQTMKTLCWFSLTDSWTLSITYHIFRVAFIKRCIKSVKLPCIHVSIVCIRGFRSKEVFYGGSYAKYLKMFLQVIAFSLIRWIKIHRPLRPGTIKWLSPWRQSSLKPESEKAKTFKIARFLSQKN